MSPSSFSFKVSVPNDPGMVTVVGELAKHAADYASLDAGKTAAFVERAKALAVKAFKAGGGASCTAAIGAADGTLTITMGGESASQSL